MTFDPSISLGTIVQIVVFTLTAVVCYTRIVARFVKLEAIVENIWDRWGPKLDDRVDTLAQRAEQIDRDARNRDEGLSLRIKLTESKP